VRINDFRLVLRLAMDFVLLVAWLARARKGARLRFVPCCGAAI
jgi:hypothetical protein